MFPRFRSMAGLAGAMLIAGIVAATPAAAARGDVWTQPAGTPEETSGHSQEVHLPCGAVDLWADGLDHTSGTWVLYHLPPPVPPGPHTEIAQGTYAYSGEGSEKIATIPLATFHLANGPHFKIEVDNDNSKSKTFWIDCKVQIATTPDPTTAVVGELLNDSATLSMGFSPTGSIVFTLFNPANVAVHSESVSVNGNGTYATTIGHVADATGTWHWQAAYGGDGGNGAVVSKPADEPVLVSKKSPTIVTTPNPVTATVGDRLQDSATLAGGFQPTGTITFSLYNPADVVAHTEDVTVAGNGTYATSNGFIAGLDGTWHWKAEYSGDSNNNAVASSPADEPVVVSPGEIVRVQPAITTTPQPATAFVGDTLKDSASLTGGDDPQGTITFTLLDPSNTPVHTEEVSVDGNGTYSTPAGHEAGTAGTWHWKAEYSGDAANKPAASDPADEPVVVSQREQEKAQPIISTTPKPAKAGVGATLKDTAELSEGDNPTGTIVFTLYDGAGTVVHTEQVTVNGNGSYATPTGHKAGTQGTWHWMAAYSGDANNLPATSDPADEPVVVGPGGGVLAATGYTSPGQALSVAFMALGLLVIFGAFMWRRRAA